MGTRREGFVEEACHAGFRDQIEVIGKMISGLINGLANGQV